MTEKVKSYYYKLMLLLWGERKLKKHPVEQKTHDFIRHMGTCYPIYAILYFFVAEENGWLYLVLFPLFYLVIKVGLDNQGNDIKNNISNNKSISEDISSKKDKLKSSSKGFTKEIENSLTESIKLAKEKSKPIINKAKKGIDELVNGSSNISKDQAIEDLKKIKELLDLELISQEEFDKKSKELKKIILEE